VRPIWQSVFEPPAWLDTIAHRVIGAAIDVHRVLGPGLGENVYEEALCVELCALGIPFARQVRVDVRYRDVCVGVYVADLIVDESLIVELKSVERLEPVHHAQLRAYLRAADLRLGLLLNFNVALMKDGIRRAISSPKP
jgi:GxxExxY protein